VRTPAELTEAFRDRGLKVTPQRQLIFRLLYGNGAHPSAEAVYARAVEEMPAISLRTVYQTLNDLTAMGEIHALDLGTGATRFDPNVDDHHHVVCSSCGRVVDVALTTPSIEIPEHVADAFEVDSTEVVFRGRCATCVTAPQGTSAPHPSSTTDKEGRPWPT
jgi:Fe2+ or Zn2+ uptake regulation protein